MPEIRPNPDRLLAQVQAEEANASRGSLKIFFGYAAGVGKTYAMLENARRLQASGREVVIGYVEPHARPETQALVAGLEAVPPKELTYRNVTLREFDVDAALQRHPDLLLVDELAHTNAEGSRHAKRWQDIQELLEAGINVWTTLNVQHIESLNDVVGQITNVRVLETVPDNIFEAAEELELVDLPPEDLLARLQAGKVYHTEQAQLAIQSFFQKSNLNALRELSLRQAATRIHSDVESARRQRATIEQPWATADRLLVCIGPSPTTARVIRTAKRMATALDAPWLAVSVDVPGQNPSEQIKSRMAEHFRLAERLGAETIALPGQDVAQTILEYARTHNVTKILIGKTNDNRWKRLIFGTVVDDVLEHSGGIDVYVIHGEAEVASADRHVPSTRRTDWLAYVCSAAIVAGAGLLAAAFQQLHWADSEANTVMLLLAGLAWAAFRYERRPAILASVLAVLIFDYCFVPPYFSFSVTDTRYLVTFAVMLSIGLLISTLASKLKIQIENTRQREQRTTALFQLGKQLSSLYGKAFLASAAGKTIGEMFHGEVAIYLRGQAKGLDLVFGHETTIAQHSVSDPAAHWVAEHDQMAGAGADTLPNSNALFLPLIGSQRTFGAIAVRVSDAERLIEPDQRRLLEACANQLALALERDQLAIDAAEAHLQAEAEQVRNSLLSSVSHDLKTPLAAIAGASSSLLESASLDEATRRQLLETVAEEATRLNRLLENILQMSKLDAGAAAPNKQWHVLEEIVGSALHRTRSELQSHPVEVRLPRDLPLLNVDGLLLEQVFVNLLENAARYTPPDSHIRITAAVDGQFVRISVADDGPGLPPGSLERIFERFYRASPTADGGRGSGLGLAICRAIIKAHGGDITASNRPGGGAEFVIRLPLPQNAPQVDLD